MIAVTKPGWLVPIASPGGTLQKLLCTCIAPATLVDPAQP
jgi:hypothetical protein